MWYFHLQEYTHNDQNLALLCYLLGCLEPPIQTKLRRRTLSISWQFLIHNKIHLFLRLSTSYLKDNVLIPEARKKHKVPYIQLWCYRTSCLSLWVSPRRICLARGRPRLACLCSPRWPTEPAGRPGFLSSTAAVTTARRWWSQTTQSFCPLLTVFWMISIYTWGIRL